MKKNLLWLSQLIDYLGQPICSYTILVLFTPGLNRLIWEGLQVVRTWSNSKFLFVHSGTMKNAKLEVQKFYERNGTLPDAIFIPVSYDSLSNWNQWAVLKDFLFVTSNSSVGQSRVILFLRTEPLWKAVKRSDYSRFVFWQVSEQTGNVVITYKRPRNTLAENFHNKGAVRFLPFEPQPKIVPRIEEKNSETKD